MLRDGLEARIDAVRRFNRFFTRRIGVLREGLLHTPYSLTEARILFEISHRAEVAASDLSRELGLDPGYLIRIMTRRRCRRHLAGVSAQTYRGPTILSTTRFQESRSLPQGSSRKR